MRYVISRLEHEEREMTYRFYVADSLRLVPQGKYRTYTLMEMYNPEMIKEEKTGDEIVVDIMNGAGLSFG